MKLFLTSSPIGIYRSEEPLDYVGFNPKNGMVDELKKYWSEDARCMLISAFPDDYEINDRMREDFAEIRGEAYQIREGEIRQIGKEGAIYRLNGGNI